jgi:hypothetical protein
MPEVPLGLTYEEVDGCLVIREKTADGLKEIKIPPELMNSLKAAIDFWKHRHTSNVLEETSGAVLTLSTQEVARVRVWEGMLQEVGVLEYRAPKESRESDQLQRSAR